MTWMAELKEEGKARLTEGIVVCQRNLYFPFVPSVITALHLILVDHLGEATPKFCVIE